MKIANYRMGLTKSVAIIRRRANSSSFSPLVPKRSLGTHFRETPFPVRSPLATQSFANRRFQTEFGNEAQTEFGNEAQTEFGNEAQTEFGNEARSTRANPIDLHFSILLSPLIACLLLAAGCSPPSRPSVVKQTTRATDDTGVSVTEMLRQGADIDAWRREIEQLNRYLGDHPKAQPRPLSDEERELLAKQVNLDRDELAELENSTFTPLDAHYLEMAFVLRDAAHALNGHDLPALDQATKAFDWVVRQVRLQQGEDISVPPLLVLRRGWGTAQERSLAFLALLDALGIDGCMVAVPAARREDPLRAWVPGALVGSDIYLFDTRLGLALPGPDGKGIATLAQVRAGLDLRQLLKVQDTCPYDLGPENTRHAEVEVAYSLSSLAPRMEFLQSYLAASEKINLWVDPVGRFKRFQAAAGGVRVWNSPGDVNNLLRVSRAFLPKEEGGVAQQPFRELVRQQVVPWQYFPQQLRGVRGEPGQRLQIHFAAPFIYFSTEPRMPPDLLVAWLPGLSEESAEKPGARKLSENLQRSPLPRSQMVHGRLDEAASVLVAMRYELERQKAIPSGPKLDEAVRRWSEKAVAVYADLIRAEQQAGNAREKDAAPAPPVAEARNRVNHLWASEFRPVSAVLQIAMADPMLERVLYNLALCKQEKAERFQAKRDHALRLGKSLSSAEATELASAWKSASSWWQSYLNEHSSAEAAPTARLLRARALQALGDRAGAIGLLENLSGVSIDLEKFARLYLAKQLKIRP
jgi:hypothetical protein